MDTTEKLQQCMEELRDYDNERGKQLKKLALAIQDDTEHWVCEVEKSYNMGLITWQELAKQKLDLYQKAIASLNLYKITDAHWIF